jgi:hypothetical protein
VGFVDTGSKKKLTCSLEGWGIETHPKEKTTAQSGGFPFFV